MAEKRYYWLKLQRDFFNNPEIKILRRVAGGDTYTLIYLEMLLMSLENEGYLYFEHIGDDMADELSAILSEKKEDVQFLLAFLENKSLIQISDGDAYYLSNIKEMIGRETGSAKRVRALRQRQKNQSDSIPKQKALQSNTSVTERNVERETEEEKELEKETDEDLETSQSSVGQNLFEFYENNIAQLSPLIHENISGWVTDFIEAGSPSEVEAQNVLIMAMTIAVERNKRNWSYIKGILTNWEKSKLVTVKQIKAHENRRSNEKSQTTGGESYGGVEF